MQVLLLLALVVQGDIAKEFESALVGKQLTGPDFHQAIDPILERYGALHTAKFQRTVGDPRGLVLTLSGSGDSWDSTKTWRVYLWPENAKIRAQVIDRFGDFNNSAVDSYTDGEIFWRGDRLVIAGRDLDGTRTSRAGLTSFQLRNAEWIMRQHLASERQGVAAFARLKKVIDPSRVIVKTRLRPENFRVPPEGPMLTYTETWLLNSGVYQKGKPILQETATAALDRIAGYALKGNRKAFNQSVPEQHRNLVWRFLTKANVSFESMAANNPDEATRFRLVDEGFEITFTKVAAAWVISNVVEK